MTDRRSIPRLGGITELSKELGVPPTTLSMWDHRRATTKMPEPLARLTCGPVWDVDEVVAWYPTKVDGRKNRRRKVEESA